MKHILGVTLLAMIVCSCANDDDFGESIYGSETEAQNSATAPFDNWLAENFVKPYNTEIQYKFNLPASKYDYLLAPADYKKSQLLANFIKYLFYEVYAKHAGEEFMKTYAPRIIHFIGSAAYSPTLRTYERGYASGGVKITLISVNELKLWSKEDQYKGRDIDVLNDKQFHTMHHEFSHILHQTKTYPVTFGQINPGDYDGREWQKRDSVKSHSLGFVTQYASSANYEDFVEMLSCTITDSDIRWMRTIIDACANGGVKDGDKKRIYNLIDSLEIGGLDDPEKEWNKFALLEETCYNSETGEETVRYVPEFHKNDAIIQAAVDNPEYTLTYKEVKKFTSFRDYLDNWVQTDETTTSRGMNAILQKFDIATKWYTEKWGLYLFQIRREVRQRQSKINEYIDKNVKFYELQ